MIFAISFTVFFFINFIYIIFWKNYFKETPTGAGIFLLIPCVYYVFNQNINLYLFNILLIFSLVYFFDDLIKINFKIRIFLQILAGVIIFLITKENINNDFLFLVVPLFFLICNLFNFQDGEDLNIFIILFLIFFSVYIYSDKELSKAVSKLILIYLLSFAFFNRKPNTLFFGDSGCYVATIVLFLLVLYNLANETLIKSVIAILLFPLFDVGLVIVYRILKKENLLTRNYYHIYQKLNIKLKGFLYIVPNFLFAIINFYLLNSLHLDVLNIIYVLTLNFCGCLIIQFSIYKFLNNVKK